MRGWLCFAVLTLVAAVPPAAQDVYVPNQASDDVKIFDIHDPLDTVTRRTGREPHGGIASLDARYVFISNRADDTISVFDTQSRMELDTDAMQPGLTRIVVGDQPHGMAITPDNRYLFVANDGSGDVSVIDIATFQVVATLPAVGLAPHMIEISPGGGEAWVGNIGGGDVAIIDVDLAINDPLNAVVCVTPGGVGVQCRIPAGPGTEGLAFTHDGRTVYAANGGNNTVTVIDARARTVIGNLFVPGSPRRVHVRPDGLRAYVSEIFGTQVAVIDTATHELVPAELLDNVPEGLGMDFSADGQRLYVANFFSSSVTVVDLPDTGMRPTIPTGSNPDSATILPETVSGVGFADESTLVWAPNFVAQEYSVYRGSVSELPDYGSCRNGDDADLSDLQFSDTDVPGVGEAFLYLVAIRHDGPEGIVGYATDGTLRQPATPCPP